MAHPHLTTRFLLSDAQINQPVDESSKNRGLQARSREDDTFLNIEKGCLFLLTTPL